MKTLVYENYEKFISAGDTIGKLRANVADMELELTRLADTVTAITTQSQSLSQTLGPKHDKIKELSVRNGTLIKLQHIFDLPATLKKQVQRNEYLAATMQWFRTRDTLL